MRQAQAGIENLKDKVDSLIVILNDKLEDEVGENATMLDCFAAADDVLYKACNGIAEIIHTPGLINVDFADLCTVMSERGTAMMGTATASGENRAKVAAEKAIACPLLEGANLQGARGLLVYVTATAETMTHREVQQVMSIMKNFVSKDALQILGTAFDNTMGEELRVTVVATGLDRPAGDVADAPAPQVWQAAAPQQTLADNGLQPAPAPQQPERPTVPTFGPGFGTGGTASSFFTRPGGAQPAAPAAAPQQAPAQQGDQPNRSGDASAVNTGFSVPSFLRHNGS